MIEFGDFEKKFLKRWVILFAIGCVVVSIFIEGDLVGLVRSGGAPINKYIYALMASAIVALLSLDHKD